MGLFGFRKKKEEEKRVPACCCSADSKVEESASCCCSSADQAEVATSTCCGEPVDGICCIKVLGAGCKSCHEQYEYAKVAAKNLGLSVEVEYVTDMQKVMEYGVMSMPAVVVNEKVVSFGKVLKTADVEKLLRSN